VAAIEPPKLMERHMSKSAKTDRPKNQSWSKKKSPQSVGNKTKSPTLPSPRLKPSARPGVRADSKLSTMLALLRRREGATLEQLTKATGWQSHSVRGAMSGAIKKKMGLTIASAKVAGVRTYHVATAGSA
jgi:hypothetical protein